MPFKIRDLMITVIPDTLDPEIFSPGPCDAGSEVPPGPPPRPQPNVATLATGAHVDELRMVLQYALAQLGGPLSVDEMRIRSIAEVNELESRLSSALEEVRALRDRFTTST